MKKTALSVRTGILFGMISVVCLVGILVLIWGVSKGGVSEEMAGVLAGGLIISHAVICCYFLRFILRPYLEMKKIYGRFAQGQAYDEMFGLSCGWMPGWDEVMKRFRHLLNKQDAIRMSKKQAEYLALQNQINPHFLYNTLEAIRGDAMCAGMDSIAETTEALSIFFRYAITGVDNFVTLEEEIDNVENYFTIQHYRFEDKLKLEINYPEGEDVLQLKLPKLTIQPFVENAIFHGLEKKVQGGTVRIKIETTRRKLLIRIMDDGVGMEEEMVEQINSYFDQVAVSYVGEDKKRRGGIAMKNVNSRIKLLFGEEYGVHLYSTKNIGTDVSLTLPKIRKGSYEERIAEN